MSFSIRTKALFPSFILTLLMLTLVTSAWYALNETTELNDSLAQRFDEIEEVRQIETLVGELIYPHLSHITSPSNEAIIRAEKILSRINLILEDLNNLAVVNSEERELIELVSSQIIEIEKVSRQILDKDIIAPSPLPHMNKMRLLEEISEKPIAKIRIALEEWHVEEAKQVHELGHKTQLQLSQFSVTIFILAVLMLLVIIFSFWLSNYVLVRPVVSLSQISTKFAAGNLKSKAPIFAQDELGTLARDINKMATSLDGMYSRLSSIAKTDQLTNLINRHGFVEQLEKEASRAKRYETPLSLLIIDIDDFKSINDSFGHSIGDNVLKIIADISIKVFRDSDYCVRYGGEEFVILLPQTPLQNAYEAAERFRKTVQLETLTFDGNTCKISVSIGVAQYKSEISNNSDKSCENLIKNADKALYEAKNNGKNQTVIFKS